MNENIYFLSDTQIFEAVGGKIRFWRLQQNMSQAELSKLAMISLSTLNKLERGEPISFDKFLKVVRVLRKLEIFDSFIAEEEVSPAQYFKMQEQVHHRKRASKQSSR